VHNLLGVIMLKENYYLFTLFFISALQGGTSPYDFFKKKDHFQAPLSPSSASLVAVLVPSKHADLKSQLIKYQPHYPFLKLSNSIKSNAHKPVILNAYSGSTHITATHADAKPVQQAVMQAFDEFKKNVDFSLEQLATSPQTQALDEATKNYLHNKINKTFDQYTGLSSIRQLSSLGLDSEVMSGYRNSITELKKDLEHYVSNGKNSPIIIMQACGLLDKNFENFKNNVGNITHKHNFYASWHPAHAAIQNTVAQQLDAGLRKEFLNVSQRFDIQDCPENYIQEYSQAKLNLIKNTNTNIKTYVDTFKNTLFFTPYATTFKSKLQQEAQKNITMFKNSMNPEIAMALSPELEQLNSIKQKIEQEKKHQADIEALVEEFIKEDVSNIN